MSDKLIKNLNEAVSSLQSALNEEIDKKILTGDYDMMVDESPGDLSARYWLTQFLDPLNHKELKSVVYSFMVQLLNEEQSKMLVKFLLVRFPSYYKETAEEASCPEPEPEYTEPSLEESVPL